jgi:uncharacterized RDD family membrane protein YckC
MKKLLLQLHLLGSSLLIALSLQAQAPEDPLEQPKKTSDEPGATNVLERQEERSVESSAPVKKSRSSRHRHYSDRTIFGSDAVLAEGDAVNNMVVIGGSAEVNGQVRGDLVVIGGSVTMGTNAEVRGSLVVIGGSLDAPPGVQVGDDRWVLSPGKALVPRFEALEPALVWLTGVAMTARPFPYRFGWSWVIAGIFLLLYVLASILFPRPLERTVQVLELRPGGAFLTGLLAIMLAAPLIIFLVFSVVGVVLVPVIVFGMFVALFFGKVAVYRYAGQQLSGQIGAQFLQKPLIALLIGAALFYALYMVQILGFIVWGAIVPLALGAALLAFFNRFSAPKPVPPPVEAQTPLPGPPPPLSGQPAGIAIASSYSSYRVGFWYRFLATVIDAAIIGALFAALHIKGPSFILIWVAYHVGMWAWKGATVGQMALRLKVVRVDGQPVDFGTALVRAFSAFISAAALCLGFFWAGWTKERQSWHDRIAGTCVVKVSPALAPAF